jgi:bifunctional non-homologous end joining protein LigD
VKALQIPRDGKEVVLEVDGRSVKVTNLAKPFWPELGLTKADLLQYYVDVAPVLLPHIAERAMVMRRYPDGAQGKSFFMKRTPKGAPAWLETISIDHGAGNIIDFPVISDVASLLWVVNLGCIDLNPWYSRKDDIDRPDYLHFDLDPGEASFAQVLETALAVHEALEALGMPSHVKTSGSKGAHVYVPIVRGPLQQEVWTFAKALAWTLAGRYPELATAEYAKAKRPKGRVLIDYNQNRWGSTLASVYSVRPTARAGASAPITWAEAKKGCAIEDFRLDNLPARIAKVGDLWAPLAPGAKHRFDLAKVMK